MVDLGEFSFTLVSELILGVVQDRLQTTTLDFFQRRRIESRVKDATAEVVQDLSPFLEQEKISLEKQQRLIETCIRELEPFTQNPEELFKGSLDGQKIFDKLYHEKELPEEILEDDLRDVYSLLFQRIAALLCKIPAAVKDWESEAWSENYRRLDEVASQLKTLFAQVDELANAPRKDADKTLTMFKRSLAQKIGLQLDITGLRADRPYSGDFNAFFVLPEIKKLVEGRKDVSVLISEPEDCFNTFTQSRFLGIVFGLPGAGKSTWSKWLQRETLKADWPGIGIRIELRDLQVNDLPSVYELVRNVAGKQLAEDLTSQRIRKWLDEGHLVFILDGFDEIKPAYRNKVIQWVRDAKHISNGCPFVITSRPLSTDHLKAVGRGWSSWSIEPFDKKRIITYISKWYKNSPLLTDSDRNTDALDLAGDWFADPTLVPLTSNPLLLSTLLMVHHLDGKLPSGRANLYKRYVDGMLGIWDDRHKLEATDIKLNPVEKRRILQAIALHLFLSEQETIEEDLLCERLDRYLPTINVKVSSTDVLAVLRERSGLIIGPGVYSFAHKTIAEFLVAETVLQGDQHDDSGNRIDRFHLFGYRNEDRWNMVLFFWAGLAAFIDVESFINECIKERNWRVAYGLLLDQYERFTESRRKELLSHLKTIKDDDPGWNIIRWGHGDLTVAVPEIEINGFGDTYTHVWLSNLIADGTIRWSDFSSTTGKMHYLMWMLFALETNNTRQWIDVIQSPCPECDQPIACSKLIALWALTSWLDNFKEIYENFIKAFPDLSEYVLLGLMSQIVDHCIYDDNDLQFGITNEHMNTAVTNTINILLQSDIERVCTRIEADQSMNVKKIYNTKNEKDINTDLASCFLKVLDDLESQKVIAMDLATRAIVNESLTKLTKSMRK